ncbi:hypothetical protein GALMADRAFT_258502, partial [Galerina marginata CBS 339.88]
MDSDSDTELGSAHLTRPPSTTAPKAQPPRNIHPGPNLKSKPVSAERGHPPPCPYPSPSPCPTVTRAVNVSPDHPPSSSANDIWIAHAPPAFRRPEDATLLGAAARRKRDSEAGKVERGGRKNMDHRLSGNGRLNRQSTVASQAIGSRSDTIPRVAQENLPGDATQNVRNKGMNLVAVSHVDVHDGSALPLGTVSGLSKSQEAIIRRELTKIKRDLPGSDKFLRLHPTCDPCERRKEECISTPDVSCEGCRNHHVACSRQRAYYAHRIRRQLEAFPQEGFTLTKEEAANAIKALGSRRRGRNKPERTNASGNGKGKAGGKKKVVERRNGMKKAGRDRKDRDEGDIGRRSDRVRPDQSCNALKRRIIFGPLRRPRRSPPPSEASDNESSAPGSDAPVAQEAAAGFVSKAASAEFPQGGEEECEGLDEPQSIIAFAAAASRESEQAESEQCQMVHADEGYRLRELEAEVRRLNDELAKLQGVACVASISAEDGLAVAADAGADDDVDMEMDSDEGEVVLRAHEDQNGMLVNESVQTTPEGQLEGYSEPERVQLQGQCVEIGHDKHHTENQTTTIVPCASCEVAQAEIQRLNAELVSERKNLNESEKWAASCNEDLNEILSISSPQIQSRLDFLGRLALHCSGLRVHTERIQTEQGVDTHDLLRVVARIQEDLDEEAMKEDEGERKTRNLSGVRHRRNVATGATCGLDMDGQIDLADAAKQAKPEMPSSVNANGKRIRGDDYIHDGGPCESCGSHNSSYGRGEVSRRSISKKPRF